MDWDNNCFYTDHARHHYGFVAWQHWRIHHRTQIITGPLCFNCLRTWWSFRWIAPWPDFRYDWYPENMSYKCFDFDHNCVLHAVKYLCAWIQLNDICDVLFLGISRWSNKYALQCYPQFRIWEPDSTIWSLLFDPGNLRLIFRDRLSIGICKNPACLLVYC